jgi:CDP-4-dehydro-6-deoxyglucose reductase, E3
MTGVAAETHSRPTALSYAQIHLVSLGQMIVAERDESILDAALRSGLNLPHSCKGGHCTSCRARVLSGSVHYPRGRPLGLTESEERTGFALLCQAEAASPELAIETRVITELPTVQVKSLPCRVEHLHELAPDVMAVELRIPSTEDFIYMPGQYLDVMLPQGRRRSFSIANAPRDDRLIELHVRRVPNGEFTEQVFSSLKEKTLLRIEGPLGQFWFRDASRRPALLVGGGTGYAPLRAMLRQLISRRDPRSLHLYWGGRTPADLYEHDTLLELVRNHSNLQYTPVVSTATGDWSGRTGLVHTALLADYPQLAAFDVYTSGPPAMVEAIRQEFISRGLPREQLFFDSFDYAPDAQAKIIRNTP